MSDDERIVLDPDHPVEAVFIELVQVIRERQQKYTHGSWDDNFVATAEMVRQRMGFEDWTPADSARFMRYLKEARQDAGRRSGRRDFADDSYRDSKLDDVNYRVLEIALEDKAANLAGVMQDLDDLDDEEEDDFDIDPL